MVKTKILILTFVFSYLINKNGQRLTLDYTVEKNDHSSFTNLLVVDFCHNFQSNWSKIVDQLD